MLSRILGWLIAACYLAILAAWALGAVLFIGYVVFAVSEFVSDWWNCRKPRTVAQPGRVYIVR